MNAQQLTTYLREIEGALTSISGLTPYHIEACKLSLKTLERVFIDTPEDLATWSHFTMVVEKEWFETAGYEVADLTKEEMDTLADELFDYCIVGRGYERGIEIAARGILSRAGETDEGDTDASECDCCGAAQFFVPDPDGVCAICGHEQTEHTGKEEA